MKKILITTFFTAVFIQLSLSFYFIASPKTANAEALKFQPQITMGQFAQGGTYEINENSIGNYIKAAYKYLIGIVGILATIVMMFGGVLWLTAGGSSGQVTEAKAYILSSITGLIIALGSFFILATVNPKLTEFAPIKILGIGEAKPVAKTPDEIQLRCRSECANTANPDVFKYDASTNKCNCDGSGTHKECVAKGIGKICDTVSTAGPDTCTDNAQCIATLSCCFCNYYGIPGGECSNGTNMTDGQCKSNCASFWKTYIGGTWQIYPGQVCVNNTCVTP